MLGIALPYATVSAREPTDIRVVPSGASNRLAWIDLLVAAFMDIDVFDGSQSHESFPKETLVKIMRDMAGAAGFDRGRCMVTRKAKWGLAAIVLLVLSVLCFMAFVPRDHKVEMIVTYPKSPPSAVWRLLRDHAAEPKWLPVFGSVVRQPDIGGEEVWTHASPDLSFKATVMTVSAVPERRYERLLLRDGQPQNESWDGRWVYELQPYGSGTRLKITEYGWTDGFAFFIAQRVLADPDAFLQYYARMIGRELNDPAEIQVLRSH